MQGVISAKFGLWASLVKDEDDIDHSRNIDQLISSYATMVDGYSTQEEILYHCTPIDYVEYALFVLERAHLKPWVPESRASEPVIQEQVISKVEQQAVLHLNVSVLIV